MCQLMYNSYLLHAGVAQLFRARPCQGRGQGLESPHPHQIKFRPRGRIFIWDDRVQNKA